MARYPQALHATLSGWVARAPKDAYHPLRHLAPKRRLFRSTRRHSFEKVVGCLFGYDNREHDCIGTPQANKLVLGIGTKKIHESTGVHVRTIQRQRKDLRDTGWIEIKEKARRDPKGKFTFIPALEKFTEKAYETIGFVRDPRVYYQQKQQKNQQRTEKLKPLVKGYADEAWKRLHQKFGDALNKNTKAMQAVLMQLNFGKQITMKALFMFVESLLATGPPPNPIPA